MKCPSCLQNAPTAEIALWSLPNPVEMADRLAALHAAPPQHEDEEDPQADSVGAEGQGQAQPGLPPSNHRTKTSITTAAVICSSSIHWMSIFIDGQSSGLGGVARGVAMLVSSARQPPLREQRRWPTHLHGPCLPPSAACAAASCPPPTTLRVLAQPSQRAVPWTTLATAHPALRGGRGRGGDCACEQEQEQGEGMRAYVPGFPCPGHVQHGGGRSGPAWASRGHRQCTDSARTAPGPPCASTVPPGQGKGPSTWGICSNSWAACSSCGSIGHVEGSSARGRQARTPCLVQQCAPQVSALPTWQVL